MNPIIKAAWIAALRSGEYQQGKCALRWSACLDQPAKYCCLGVLCDLHAKATGGTWEQNRYLGQSMILPEEVLHWAGLTSLGKRVYLPDVPDLASMNDRGSTFKTIADLLEQSHNL